MSDKKKGLVISGGGAKGAWGVGLLHYLIKEQNKDWDTFVGTSTGSLIIPLTSLQRMEKLKEVYTNTTQDDIFKNNPLNKNGNISIINAIWRFARGKFSFGNSENLRNLIEEYFGKKDYAEIINKTDKDVISCVANMSEDRIEYKNIRDYGYHDFCDYIWASSNVPVLMSMIEKEGSYYVDGGIKDHISIQKAIDEGCEEIDVIIFRPKENKNGKWEPNNLFDVVWRTIKMLFKQVSKDDVSLANLVAKDKGVDLNLYYTPELLTKDPLIFKKKLMKRWYNQGYRYGENNLKPTKTLRLTRYSNLKERS